MKIPPNNIYNTTHHYKTLVSVRSGKGGRWKAEGGKEEKTKSLALDTTPCYGLDTGAMFISAFIQVTYVLLLLCGSITPIHTNQQTQHNQTKV